jgi:hypothetical protein
VRVGRASPHPAFRRSSCMISQICVSSLVAVFTRAGQTDLSQHDTSRRVSSSSRLTAESSAKYGDLSTRLGSCSRFVSLVAVS